MGSNSRTRRWAITGAVVASAAAVGLAGNAMAGPGAGPAEVTRGTVAPFAAGTGGTTSGHAEMVRTAHGETIVSVHLKGLVPGRTYASHVHAAPCAVGAADGHYKHDPAGASTPPNEIWPGDGPFKAGPSGNANIRTVADFRAGVTAVSVVVHDTTLPSTANKIACADLG